jgi:phospholipid N-methyltransferase
MGTLRRRLRSLRQPRHLSAPFLPRLRQEAHGLIWFASQLVRSPREVGAICPSGQSLARGMAALIPETPGLVVEFGAGTGVVTQAILDRGVARDRLLVIEYSPRFCAILRRKFPDLTIIQGDAAKLSSYLPPDARIAAIVSSLPLMSLPKQTRASIIAQVRSVMRQEGCIIQFTYALWAASPFRRAGYQPDSRKIILLNLPPARLERFRIAGQNPAASTLRDCAIR